MGVVWLAPNKSDSENIKKYLLPTSVTSRNSRLFLLLQASQWSRSTESYLPRLRPKGSDISGGSLLWVNWNTSPNHRILRIGPFKMGFRTSTVWSLFGEVKWIGMTHHLKSHWGQRKSRQHSIICQGWSTTLRSYWLFWWTKHRSNICWIRLEPRVVSLIHQHPWTKVDQPHKHRDKAPT